MSHKIISVILTLLISVSSLSAYSSVLSGCKDRSCCCGAAMVGMMEAGQREIDTKFQTLKGCCCGDVTGSACSLTTVLHLEKIGWALSSNRVDLSESNLSGIVSITDLSKDSQVFFQSETGAEATHPCFPPIYLSSMSFLC